MSDLLLQKFRDQYRNSPTYMGHVELGTAAGGGGSRPVFATLEDGSVVFAKRAMDPNGVPEGAHEFMAARLGEMLGVYVPPVAFWRAPDGILYSLSLRAFRQPLTLQDANLAAEDWVGLEPLFSASWVFHTWIADTDHQGHPGNMILDSNSPIGQPQLACIDHAFSLSKSWHAGYPAAAPVANYYIHPDRMRREVVAAHVEKVQSILDDDCKSLLSLIPSDFLPDQLASVIFECLARRRAEIGAAFYPITRQLP